VVAVGVGAGAGAAAVETALDARRMRRWSARAWARRRSMSRVEVEAVWVGCGGRAAAKERFRSPIVAPLRRGLEGERVGEPEREGGAVARDGGPITGRLGCAGPPRRS